MMLILHYSLSTASIMISTKQKIVVANIEVTPVEQNKAKLKLTLLLVSSLTIMSIITISPALPQMTAAFSDVKNSAFLVKLVLTIPALMIALFSPVTGRLIDH